MRKELKISIAIFIISLLGLGVSLKIKPLSVVSPDEKNMLEYAFPEITIKERVRISYSSLQNPFETSKIVEAKKNPKESVVKEAPLPVLSFIYEGRNKYAVIGDSIVREGDSINGYQVKAIFKDKVLIKNKQGETKWLKLENY
ncbi:MAG: hypothetical protein ACPLZA_04620 [Thermodesulfovibrio sp.]